MNRKDENNKPKPNETPEYFGTQKPILCQKTEGLLLKFTEDSKEQLIEKSLSFLVATFALFFLTFLLSSPITLTLAGVAGSMQANEVIKSILNVKNSLNGNIMIFNALNSNFRKIKLLKNPRCINANLHG